MSFETLSLRQTMKMAFGIDIKKKVFFQKRELPLGFPAVAAREPAER